MAPLGAHLAPADVPRQPPAQQRGERALPGVHHRRQVGAVRPADPGQHHGRGGDLQLVAGPAEPGRRLPGGQAEHRGDLRRGQVVAQREFEHLALAAAQLAQRLVDQVGQLGVLVLVRFGQWQAARRGAAAAGQPGAYLEPGQRVQPGPQSGRVLEPAHALLRGDQRVVHGVGGQVVGPGEEEGVVVQPLGVGVVQLGGSIALTPAQSFDELLIGGTIDGRPSRHGFPPRG